MLNNLIAEIGINRRNLISLGLFQRWLETDETQATSNQSTATDVSAQVLRQIIKMKIIDRGLFLNII